MHRSDSLQPGHVEQIGQKIQIGFAGVHGDDMTVTIIAASVPSASAAYVLARQMGGNAGLMAEILTLQTLLALLSMPVLISLLG